MNTFIIRISLGCAAVFFSAFFSAVFYSTALAATVAPDLSEATFSNPTDITHPFFSLPVGKEMRFEGETEDGLETVEISIPGDTREILGVETLVYRDKVWVDGEFVEDTFDYLAQDDEGNVWYFGEDVDNYEDGVVADHDGSWIAGVDGAEAGYWMPAVSKHAVGYSYREEHYEGEAEDEAEIVSVTESVDVEYGSFSDCIQTKNTTPLDPSVLEYKYYCEGAGGLTLETKPDENVRVELTDVEMEDADDDDDGDGEDDDTDDDDDDAEGVEALEKLQMRLIELLQKLIKLLTNS